MFNMTSILSDNFLKSNTDVCDDIATYVNFTNVSTIRAPPYRRRQRGLTQVLHNQSPGETEESHETRKSGES
jgi:hypothetical protein